MRLELGARVKTSDGHDAGEIDRLIVDPEHDRVKAAVLRKGFLLPRDVEVPLEVLAVNAAGELTLPYTSGQLDELPEFDESRYVTPPLEYGPRAGFPATGIYWPSTYGLPDERLVAEDAASTPMQTALNRQLIENAVVGEGSDVLTSDGEKVGAVQQLSFDAATGLLESITISSGIVRPEETTLPADLVDHVDDGVVYLALNAVELRSHLT